MIPVMIAHRVHQPPPVQQLNILSDHREPASSSADCAASQTAGTVQFVQLAIKRYDISARRWQCHQPQLLSGFQKQDGTCGME